MKKITKVVAILTAMIMVLTGCVSETSTVKINSDESGKITSTMLLDKAKTDAYAKANGMTSDQSLEESLKESLGNQGKVSIVTGSDKRKYYQIIYSENIKSGELVTTLSEQMSTDVYATKSVFYCEYKLDGDDKQLFEEYSKGQDISSMITLRYEVEFTSNIVYTTGTVDKTNPKKAVFTIDINKTNTIFASTDKNVTLSSIKGQTKQDNTVSKTKIKSLKVTKIKKKKGTVTLKLKKVSGAQYKVTYSTSKKFKKSKTKTFKKTTIKINNLKKGKKYYFKVVCTKKTAAGKTINSKAVKKSIKIK